MPLLPVFLAGILLWVLASGVWATVGMVLVLVTAGIVGIWVLIFLGVLAAFARKL